MTQLIVMKQQCHTNGLWLTRFDGFTEAFVRNLYQFLCFWTNFFTYTKGLVKVPMKATMVHSNINVTNVAIHQWSLVWDPVADNLIHRSAARFRKTIVVERAWITVTLNTGFVNYSVYFIGGYTYCHSFGGFIEDLSPQLNKLQKNLLKVQMLGAECKKHHFK